MAVEEARLERAFFTALRLARDSPLRVGISFNCVGGPSKAPRNIACKRRLVSELFSLGADMIPTPYRFEAHFSAEEFCKIGQLASRWAHIEHTIGNCLRRILDMDPGHATIMVFSLNLDMRMTRIEEIRQRFPLTAEQTALFLEIRPLIRAVQYIRNTVLHGVVIGGGEDPDETTFHLRSKNRNITKSDFFECEELINYAAHVTYALRLSLGEKDDPTEHTYTLPDRPPIPAFLPGDCQAFPEGSKGGKRSPPRPSPE